jgi:signal transduction histidine kinase
MFPPKEVGVAVQRNSAAKNGSWRRHTVEPLLLAATVAASSFLPAAAFGEKDPEIRRVLVLTEVGTSTPAVSAALQQIEAAVRERLPYEVEFYTESLETTLFPEAGSQNELYELYSRKYHDRRPDEIIALGPSPIKFLANSRKQFFPDTPIVFCGSSKEQADNPDLDSSFTGAWMTIDPRRTIETALRLQPLTQHAAVVGGTTSYDRHLEDLVKTSLGSFQNKLDTIDLTNLDMPTLLTRVKQLPVNTIILYTSMGKDSQKTHFVSPKLAFPLVADAANAPIFGFFDTMLGPGTVGGYVSSFAGQGRIAAEDTIKILEGTKPEDIPIVQDTSVYMFDWRALKRWGFSESNLPAGSIVLYREPTLWQKHKWPVLAVSLATFLLVLLGGYLLIERWRRGVAETELEVERNFERLISELSTYLIDLPADQVDSGIDSALNRVAGSLAIDRIGILEFMKDGRELLTTHSSGGQSGAMLGLALKSEDFPYVIGRLSKNETLVFSNPELCLGMSAGERELISWRGIQAGIFVPLEARGIVLGVLSFVSQQESKWSNNLVDHCRTLGQSFANALVRQRSDEALLTSELLKSAILISLSSNVVVTDRNGEILSTNSSIEPDLLYTLADSAPEFRVGANCLEIYQRSSRAGNALASKIMNGIKSVLEGARPRFELEWVSDFKEGRKWIMTSVMPLEMKAGGLVITHTEITDRKQAEEERLELSGRLIDMQEKERSRLARELHDDFNQRLAVLAIDLERAAQTIDDSPVVARQRLHELWSRASEIGTDLHSLSHRLHSSTLESLGLVLGVSSLCAEFEEQQGIQVDFTHKNIARSVSPDIALCLFRVAQEGLRNVKRHSGASRAEIRLEAAEQEISLSISDAGTGFDSRTSRARDGLGIRSMQERLRLLGGRFEISSQPGEGTMIHVSIPLRATASSPLNGPASIPFKAKTNGYSYKQA